MTKDFIVYFIVLLITLAITITFGVLWDETNVFTVPGTIVSVVYCKKNCFFTDQYDEVCYNTTTLALDWMFKNITYHALNFVTGMHQCRDCCYDDVNRSISVEINPDAPLQPLRFWMDTEKPRSILYEFLLTASSIILFMVVAFGCVSLYQIFRHRSYENL